MIWNTDLGNDQGLRTASVLRTTSYSHCSWPLAFNKQLPRTMVWASLPVQLSNTSVQLVWRETVKQLSTAPLNPNLSQRPCIEILHVTKLWIGLWRETVLCITCRDRRVSSSAARVCSTSLIPFTPSTFGRHSAGVRFGRRKIFQHILFHHISPSSLNSLSLSLWIFLQSIHPTCNSLRPLNPLVF